MPWRAPRGSLSSLLVAALLLSACWTAGSSETPPGGHAPPATGARGVWFRAACELPVEHLRRIERGYFDGRSPELLYVPRQPNSFGGFFGATHSGPWRYLQSVPLVLYGPGVIRSEGELKLPRNVTVADIAPTAADMVGTPFPADRAGEPLTEALLPAEERTTPTLLVTIVLDGAGWNLLEQWPDAWPFLAELMEEGTSVAGAEVGSSPSSTPPVHATMGTGVFPARHGVVDLDQPIGDEFLDSYPDNSPKNLLVSTLADIYDPRTANEAKIGLIAEVGWHLGMMGHGAYLEEGDKDIAVLLDKEGGRLVTNSEWYELPSYLEELPGPEVEARELDLQDGEVDDTWRGREILADPAALPFTPAWAGYQNRLIEAVVENEGFGADDVTDMLYINYKQIDHASHRWNMLDPSMEEIVRANDDALRELVQFLDDEVGSRNWALTVTADHGVTPSPQATGAWPINIDVLPASLAGHFGLSAEDLVRKARPVGMWLDQELMRSHGITEEAMADFLMGYTIRDNVAEDLDVPRQYEDRLDEQLFAAAFPSDRLPEILACAERRQDK
jgi:hypothetical protein